MITKGKRVRISAKAVVIRRGRVLLMRAEDRWGTYYLLPGGGQRRGETLSEAVKRECLEETGAEVAPGKLLFVRDYIGANHEFAKWDRGFHQVELMFLCGFRRMRTKTAAVPDARQAGAEWVPLDKLKTLRLYPSALKTLLPPARACGGPAYLGDVN